MVVLDDQLKQTHLSIASILARGDAYSDAYSDAMAAESVEDEAEVAAMMVRLLCPHQPLPTSVRL